MQGSFKSLRNLTKQKLCASRKENQNHRTGEKLKKEERMETSMIVITAIVVIVIVGFAILAKLRGKW